MKPSWFVYLLRCGDGTYYAGVTNDVARRTLAHREGRGAKYTRGRGPLRLIAVSEALEKSHAHRVEARVKKLPKGEKGKAVRRAHVASEDS